MTTPQQVLAHFQAHEDPWLDAQVKSFELMSPRDKMRLLFCMMTNMNQLLSRVCEDIQALKGEPPIPIISPPQEH